MIAKLATLMEGKVLLAYHLVHLMGHIFAAYALLFTLKVFTYSKTQTLAAILVLLAAVPLLSLAVLPAGILRLLGIGSLPQLPGIGDFIWWSQMASSTALQAASSSLTGPLLCWLRLDSWGYIFANDARHFGYACLVAFLSASVHPFEIIVIVGSGAITLCLDRWTVNRRRGLVEAGLLAAAGAAGLLPIMVQMLTVPWLQEAAAVNKLASLQYQCAFAVDSGVTNHRGYSLALEATWDRSENRQDRCFATELVHLHHAGHLDTISSLDTASSQWSSLHRGLAPGPPGCNRFPD